MQLLRVSEPNATKYMAPSKAPSYLAQGKP